MRTQIINFIDCCISFVACFGSVTFTVRVALEQESRCWVRVDYCPVCLSNTIITHQDKSQPNVVYVVNTNTGNPSSQCIAPRSPTPNETTSALHLLLPLKEQPLEVSRCKSDEISLELHKMILNKTKMSVYVHMEFFPTFPSLVNWRRWGVSEVGLLERSLGCSVSPTLPAPFSPYSMRLQCPWTFLKATSWVYRSFHLDASCCWCVLVMVMGGVAVYSQRDIVDAVGLIHGVRGT
jgi:hypothetical protein